MSKTQQTIEDPQMALAEQPAAQVPATRQAVTIESVMQQAIEQKMPPETIGKLLDVAERLQANQAKIIFNDAMVSAQSALPRVCSDARNDQTKSDYPTETRVRQTIQKRCLEHGFTFFVDEAEPPRDDILCVRLTIRHAGGYESMLTRYGKVDNLGPKGNPNSTHVQGGQKTVTYLGRRMLLQAFGVVVDGDDTDGNDDVDVITPDQVSTLENMIADTGTDKVGFLVWATRTANHQIESLSDMPADLYSTAIAILKKKGSK
tara:strand:- start:8250 stop:9032 length:783 start_codon:yes stop_codon:yes gene_type:complete